MTKPEPLSKIVKNHVDNISSVRDSIPPESSQAFDTVTALGSLLSAGLKVYELGSDLVGSFKDNKKQ